MKKEIGIGIVLTLVIVTMLSGCILTENELEQKDALNIFIENHASDDVNVHICVSGSDFSIDRDIVIDKGDNSVSLFILNSLTVDTLIEVSFADNTTVYNSINLSETFTPPLGSEFVNHKTEFKIYGNLDTNHSSISVIMV